MSIYCGWRVTRLAGKGILIDQSDAMNGRSQTLLFILESIN